MKAALQHLLLLHPTTPRQRAAAPRGARGPGSRGVPAAGLDLRGHGRRRGWFGGVVRPRQASVAVGTGDAQLRGAGSSAPGRRVLGTQHPTSIASTRLAAEITWEQLQDNMGAAPKMALGVSGKLLSIGTVAHSPRSQRRVHGRVALASGSDPAPRWAVAIPGGDSHGGGTSRVELSGAPWVWVSSSAPRGRPGFPIG